MADLLSISLNVRLPQQVAEGVAKIQQLLGAVSLEQRTYDSTGHLSLLNKFMVKEDFPKFVNVVNEYIKDKSPFEVKFSRIGLTPNEKYAFLYFDDSSNQVMSGINADLLKATHGLGNETWNGKPALYPYTPHISILKIDVTQASLIESLLSGIQLPKDFLATSMEISKEIKVNGLHQGFNKDFLVEL